MSRSPEFIPRVVWPVATTSNRPPSPPPPPPFFPVFKEFSLYLQTRYTTSRPPPVWISHTLTPYQPERRLNPPPFLISSFPPSSPRFREMPSIFSPPLQVSFFSHPPVSWLSPHFFHSFVSHLRLTPIVFLKGVFSLFPLPSG